MKRKRLIKAAKEINDVMMFDTPIDVDKSDKKLIKLIKKSASMINLTSGADEKGNPIVPDEFSEKTIEVFKFYEVWPDEVPEEPTQKLPAVPETSEIPENAISLKEVYTQIEECAKRKELKVIISDYPEVFANVKVKKLKEVGDLKDAMCKELDELSSDTYFTKIVTYTDVKEEEKEPEPEKEKLPSPYSVSLDLCCKNPDLPAKDLIKEMTEMGYTLAANKSAIYSGRTISIRVIKLLRKYGHMKAES